MISLEAEVARLQALVMSMEADNQVTRQAAPQAAPHTGLGATHTPANGRSATVTQVSHAVTLFPESKTNLPSWVALTILNVMHPVIAMALTAMLVPSPGDPTWNTFSCCGLYVL